MDLNDYKVIVFAGKGGVGKTTCAAATASHYAEGGIKTLAISTDATPSLSHIFGIEGKSKPQKIRDCLYINELGLTEIKKMWDEKYGKEVYEVFSSFVSIGYKEFIEFMISILPGLGEEFMVDYIREINQKHEYDVIIWDTAPLGQTLALLQMPSMLYKHLKMAPRVYSKMRLGQRSKKPILDIIKQWKKLSSDNIEFLRSEVKFILVTIPEALAVSQLDYVFAELEKYSLIVRELIINQVADIHQPGFLFEKASNQKDYIESLYANYSNLKITELPALPHEPRGFNMLSEVARIISGEETSRQLNNQ